MGKTGFATDEAKKRATNKQWFKTESPQTFWNQQINQFFHKISLFQATTWKKILLNWQILSAQQFFQGEKQAPQTFTLLEYMTKGDFESQGKS